MIQKLEPSLTTPFNTSSSDEKAQVVLALPQRLLPTLLPPHTCHAHTKWPTHPTLIQLEDLAKGIRVGQVYRSVKEW